MLYEGRFPGEKTIYVIIGAITLIAMAFWLHGYLQRVQHKRMKQTLSRIGVIYYALDNYWSAHREYPRGISDNSSVSSLVPFLCPTYAKTLPMRDGWGNLIGVQTTVDGSDYTLWSSGRCSNSGDHPLPYEYKGSSGERTHFSEDNRDDIIFVSGYQIQAWEGLHLF